MLLLVHVHRAEPLVIRLHVHDISAAPLLQLVFVGRLGLRGEVAAGDVLQVGLHGTAEVGGLLTAHVNVNVCACVGVYLVSGTAFSVLFQHASQIAIADFQLLGGGPLLLGHLHADENQLLYLTGEFRLELVPGQRH